MDDRPITDEEIIRLRIMLRNYLHGYHDKFNIMMPRPNGQL